MNKIWFRRKRYGWGWVPATREGWLSILIWLVLLLWIEQKMDQNEMKNITVIILMVGALIYLCYKKGEKPRWQWGKDKGTSQ